MLVDLLGEPILTASLKWDDDEEIEYPTDIDDIYDFYGKNVDVIVDAGAGGNLPSTVLNATSGQLELIREGKGVWE